MAKEPDSQDASTSKPGRRPIIIDLPAEEVGRKAAAERADAKPPQSGGSGSANPADAPGKTEATAKTATPPKTEEKPRAAEEIPSAFATRKPGASAPPPRWRLIDEPPPPRRFAPFLLAALAGAAIVAIAVIVMAFTGYFPTRSGAGISAEIEALRSDVAKLQQANPDESLTALEQQVAAIDKKIGDVAAAAPAGASNEALAELQSRFEALEQAVSAGASAASLEPRLTELANEIAALRNAAPADAASLETTLAPIREPLDAMSAQLDALSARVDAVPSEDRIAAIETNLNEASRKIDLAAALAPAVIADALAAALDSGLPFSGELAALKSIGIGADAAEQLAAVAETGLPTMAELRSGFEAAIDSTDLTPTAPEQTGTIDRLWQSAQSLVEVRPARPTEGTQPTAVIARIRGALAAGDLKSALAEWNALPDPIKTPIADWAGQVEARLQADDLAAAVRAEALAQLGAGQ